VTKRVLGVVAAFVLAAIGTLLLVSYVNGAEERALAGERVVDVLVVSEPVDAGTPAKALTGEVQLEQVPAKVRAKGAVAKLRSLEGLVASAELVPGEQVIRSRFVTPEAATSDVQKPGARSEPGDTSQQLSLSLEPERVLGGTLQEGDTVAVYASTESPLPDVTHMILHDVVVTRVQGAQPPAAKDDATQAADEAAPGNDQIVVTLALEPAAAESVVWTMEHGTIWLSLDPKGGDPAGTRLVTPEIVFG